MPDQDHHLNAIDNTSILTGYRGLLACVACGLHKLHRVECLGVLDDLQQVKGLKYSQWLLFKTTSLRVPGQSTSIQRTAPNIF